MSNLQLKQIRIQDDHNIHTCSLFCLAILAEENSITPLLLCNINKPGLFIFSFLTKEQKRKKEKRKFQTLFFNMTRSIEKKYNTTFMGDIYIFAMHNNDFFFSVMLA